MPATMMTADGAKSFSHESSDLRKKTSSTKCYTKSERAANRSEAAAKLARTDLTVQEMKAISFGHEPEYMTPLSDQPQ